ncbi:hypothetical protein L9G74_04890 [Shewanella sp. C32]|uniref:Uncharacterized protein n=1 Tax=Shewanella electrica TaxID=515560 RepID=A0ABT2FKK7_9GAMM|nr:hypothetical protein [Shewanella electrica]MCH1923862.1 hypothetical protein [Shewanella electrica]MCS4555766.1 hypothetical protein [Shewanella electrica]
MNNQTIEQETLVKEPFKIQITASFKNKSKRFRSYSSIVQGEPFSWGIKIKNIDTKATPEANIVSAGIKDLNDKFFQDMEYDEIFVRSLNPNEEIFIEIDKCLIFLEGMQWCYLTVVPKDEDKYFETYQFDDSQKKSIKFGIDEEDDNNWMDHLYIQKKMELLQSRTNNYILLLTLVTVWESVFGIKDSLKNLAEILSLFFNWVAYQGESMNA